MSISNFVIKSYLRVTKFRRRFSFPNQDNIEEARAFIENAARRFKKPEEVAIKSTTIGEINVEWYIPKEVDHKKVLLYFHGGGYSFGSINTHRALCAKISQEGRFKVLSVDYRLAPEHPYPAALEDAVEVYKWLLENGYYAHQVVIGGDSAGGGLALCTLIKLKELEVHLPDTAVLLSPWTDLKGTGESMQTKKRKEVLLDVEEIPKWGALYAGELPLNDPRLSPLYADLQGLPPLFIQVGSDEILLDDSVRLAQKAEEAGVEISLNIWKNQFHVWQISWQFLPEARKAIRQIGEYIRSRSSEVF